MAVGAPVVAEVAAAAPRPARVEAERRRIDLGSLPLNVALVLLTAVWIVPTLALLVSSFRPRFLINTTGWWQALVPPFQFTLANYREVLDTYSIGTAFINSLTIAIPATVIPIAIAAFAAYAFSWMKFPFRNSLFLLLVGLLAVPLQVTLIPVL